MSEPVIGGIPLTMLFLYFIAYAFLGWCVETTYCCICERRWVARGFLYGPICPIYGVGVLLMILFFAPLAGNLVVFYVTATVVMSAWEYLVGWFLETTTHIKYWDYSDKPFNLKGRICLQISLCWGVLSYITIFLIHPHIVSLFARIPVWQRYTLAGSVSTLLLVDVVTTIRHLALTAKLMAKLEVAGQELMLQSALAKAELGDRLDEMGDRLGDALEDLNDRVNDAVKDRETLAALKLKYDTLLDLAEKQSRRFRNRYSGMRSDLFSQRLSEVSRRGSELRERIQEARNERKASKSK